MSITEYCTLTELGELYGTTRNKVGTWLRDAGLRDGKGHPISEGMWMTVETLAPNGFTPFYVWHRESTVRLLDSLGHRQKEKNSGHTLIDRRQGTFRSKERRVMKEYLSQTELGKLFGVSSHTIGEWLRDAGLRDPGGKPTFEGHEYADTRPSTNPNTYFWVWHRKRTIRLLESRGHQVLAGGAA